MRVLWALLRFAVDDHVDLLVHTTSESPTLQHDAVPSYGRHDEAPVSP